MICGRARDEVSDHFQKYLHADIEFRKVAQGARWSSGALRSQPAWEEDRTPHSLNRGTWEGPRVSIRLSSSSRFARQTKHMLTNKKLNPHSYVVHGGSALGLGYCAQSPKVLGSSRRWLGLLLSPQRPRPSSRPSGALTSSPFRWLMGKETQGHVCDDF